MNTKLEVVAGSAQVVELAPLSTVPGTSDEPVYGWKEPFRNAIFTYSAVGLGLSAVAYALTEYGLDLPADSAFGLFCLHYGLSLAMGCVVLFNGGWGYLFKHNRVQQAAMWLVMPLWLISAFALNRSMTVFERSVPWLCWVVTGSGILIVVHIWADRLPRWGQQLLYAGLAGAWLLFAYQAVYLAALYPASFPLMLGLGISAHTFVPLTLAFVIGRQLWFGVSERTYLRPAVATGTLVPIALLVIFLFNWNRTADRLERTRVEASLRATSDLPDWVLAAQQLTANAITDRILKANSVYETSPWSRSFGELRALDDVKLHDPLVVIAQNLFPAPTFTDAEQMKLLRTVSGVHHGAESKFWSGRNLSTPMLTTQVRIWPQYRMSYTEKTVVMRSSAEWGNREALYTFHLPEGSAVSALSLWINGREEPARLTTQAKADSAYKQIVDIESRPVARDPSVLTWQEGNRVTVRVFPVPPGQDRQVKIGITSPLRAVGGQLTYQNPWFEGPDMSRAEETIKLTFDQMPADLHLPWLGEDLVNNQLVRRDTYRPDWSLSMEETNLATDKPFVLESRTYTVKPLAPTYAPVKPTDLYLDVNASWSEAEFNALLKLAQTNGIAHVWVFGDGLIELTPDNRKAVFAALNDLSFSLFPIDRITDPANALLITKGTATGPTLADLANSLFADRLSKRAASLQTPIRAVCLNDAPTTYLKTLAELRVLNLVGNATLTDVAGYVSNQRFPVQTETTNRVELPTAGIAIESQPAAESVTAAANVPDHVARLFVYNQLMQRVGRQYFDSTYRNDASLASVAQLGHVVSPVSSLVVLETVNDYDRFGIKHDNKGLDNATLKADGAVPEPHEWALLIALAVLVLWKSRTSGWWRVKIG